MNKTLITMALTALLLITMASAAGPFHKAPVQFSEGDGKIILPDDGNHSLAEQKALVAKEINRYRHQERARINLTGLQNAMVRVRNNDTKEHLEDVWTRIQAEQRATLENLTSLEFREVALESEDVAQDELAIAIEAVGKQRELFLGLIPLQHRKHYVLHDNGTVERIKKWHDTLYQEARQ